MEEALFQKIQDYEYEKRAKVVYRKKKKRYAIIAVAAVFTMLGTGIGANTAANNALAEAQTETTAQTEADAAGDATQYDSPAIAVYEKCADSVVGVITYTEQWSRSTGEVQKAEIGEGSGVVISDDGYIMTNNHVVAGGNSYQVLLPSGDKVDASLVGTDSGTDIAVLKIEATGLTPAVVGDSDSLQVGEFTLAVGNPLGELGGTVTDGIISALDREVTVENQTMNLLQTNAAVSPGNSGGGLFNERGELIGIVNAKSSGQNAEGLGFAIPVNTAIQVAEELINNGYVTGRPAMGVTVLSINDAQTAFQYGVNQAGVYVQSVNEGGAADKAGLQPGDRFVSIDGTAVNSTSDITGIIGEHAVGDTIEVQVVRGTQIVTANVTLEESTPQASSTQRTEG